MVQHFALLTILLFQSTLHALSPLVFPFANDPIDVVIPCVEKDSSTLSLCIRGIRENGANIRRVIVVSKQPFTDEAEWFDESEYPFSYQDIEEALGYQAPEHIKNLLAKEARTGWYYQQLLKLYASLVIPNISSNILILDADAIFLNPVTFLDEHNAGLYNPGEEYHIPYFEHASRLIPAFHKCFPEYSGISHHMIFQRSVIETLMEEVECNHKIPFWQIFCRLVDPNDLIHSGASEYEIYFNYIFACSTQPSIRKLLWRNIQRFSEIQSFKELGYHYVCLHAYNRIED